MARKNIQILRTKKVLIVFFSYIIICTMDISAQIAEFTQIYNNYVYLNPAFVGTTSCPHVFSSYRSKNFSQARYSTAYVSFDVDMKQSLGSCGFSLLHDVQNGVFSETELMAIYARTFRLQKYLYMKTSLAAGYVYEKSDYSDLVFSDMLHVFDNGYGTTREILDTDIRHNFNSEFGVLVYNDVFYAGMSIKNLQGNVSRDAKNANLFPRIFSFHGMAKFSTTKAYMKEYLLLFYPSVNVVIGGCSSYAQAGLILQKWMVQIGASYRQILPKNENSFAFFVGIVEKRFRFAYNCDMTINSSKQFDTHEVSFGYQFDCREKKKKFEAVKAPTF